MVHLYRVDNFSNNHIPKTIIISLLAIMVLSIMGVCGYNILNTPKDVDYKWVMANVRDVGYVPAYINYPLGIKGLFQHHIFETWRLKVFIPSLHLLAYITTYEKYKVKDTIVVGYAYSKYSHNLKFKYRKE